VGGVHLEGKGSVLNGATIGGISDIGRSSKSVWGHVSIFDIFEVMGQSRMTLKATLRSISIELALEEHMIFEILRFRSGRGTPGAALRMTTLFWTARV